MKRRGFVSGSIAALFVPTVPVVAKSNKIGFYAETRIGPTCLFGEWIWTTGKWDVLNLPNMFGQKTYCGDWLIIGDDNEVEGVLEVDLDNNTANIYNGFDGEGNIIREKVQFDYLYLSYQPLPRKS